MSIPAWSLTRILAGLPKPRITSIAREFRVAISPELTKEEQIAAFERAVDISLPELLQWLTRDELKAACRAHGLDDSGRARHVLAGRLLEAAGRPRPRSRGRSASLRAETSKYPSPAPSSAPATASTSWRRSRRRRSPTT